MQPINHIHSTCSRGSSQKRTNLIHDFRSIMSQYTNLRVSFKNHHLWYFINFSQLVPRTELVLGLSPPYFDRLPDFQPKISFVPRFSVCSQIKKDLTSKTAKFSKSTSNKNCNYHRYSFHFNDKVKSNFVFWHKHFSSKVCLFQVILSRNKHLRTKMDTTIFIETGLNIEALTVSFRSFF